MGLPSLNIEFRKKAVSLISRSSRGTVVLLLKDTTKETVINSYQSLADVTKEDWTAENYKALSLCFLGGPNRVIAVRAVKAAEAINVEESKRLFENLEFDWFAAPQASASEAQALASFFDTEKKKKYKKGKAVFHNVAADSAAVVNFTTTNISAIVSDAVEKVSSALYTARVAGLLAGISLEESATYKVLPEIVDLEQSKTPDADIDAGKFIIIFDGNKFKVGRGVTSLTTVSETMPEDFKKIKVVEAADLVRNDIKTTFDDSYVGKRNNTYDNKQLFVGAVVNYLKDLEDIVVDKDEGIEVALDTQKNRDYLKKNGIDTSEMSDLAINKANTGSRLAIRARFKFIDAMEDLDMGIYL